MPGLGFMAKPVKGVLPEGEYIAVITNTKWVESKNNKANVFLEISVDIVGYGNKKKLEIPVGLIERLNVKHPTLKTRNIARKQLGNIRVKLAVEDNGKFGMQNRITYWLPLNPKKETKDIEPETKEQPPTEEESFRTHGDGLEDPGSYGPEEEDFEVEDGEDGPWG